MRKCEKGLEVKIKLRYYKVVINPHLQDQTCLSILTSLKKKIIIDKKRTNSHELYRETKTLRMPRILHLYETMSVEDEVTFS